MDCFLDDAPHTSSDIEPEPEPEEEVDGGPYALSRRQKINYVIPPPLEDMPKPSKIAAGRNRGRHGRAVAKGRT